MYQDTVKELIQDYEEGCRVLKLTLALFGGIGTAIACYAGYKYYRKRQEYLEATANHRLLDEIITARSQRMQSDPVDLTSEGSGDNSRYPHYQGFLFTGWWPHTMIIKWLKSLSLRQQAVSSFFGGKSSVLRWF